MPYVRASRRTVAWLLACVLFAGSADLLHAHEWDICDYPVVEHDASAHRWLATSPASPHADRDHCVLCHWMRGLGAATQAAGRVAAVPDAARLLRAGELPVTDQQRASRLPARAPPLSIL